VEVQEHGNSRSKSETNEIDKTMDLTSDVAFSLLLAFLGVSNVTVKIVSAVSWSRHVLYYKLSPRCPPFETGDGETMVSCIFFPPALILLHELGGQWK